MSPRRGSWRASVAVSVSLLVLVAACGPDGIRTESGNEKLQTCLEVGGLSIEDAEDWSEAQEQKFMSDPGALTCVVTEVSPGDSLEGAMQRAFDSASQTKVVDVLTGFVHHRDIANEALANEVGTLLGALDQDDYAPGSTTYQIRAQLAWEIYRNDRNEPKIYTQWLADNPGGRDPGPTPDFSFMSYLELSPEDSPPGELYDPISRIFETIGKAQKGPAR